MRKVILYIAMSVDGYIADNNGNVSWLNQNEEYIDTYYSFINHIDTVIMGWNTYHQIVTELSPTTWIYSNLISYIITHKNITSTKQIIFYNENPCNLVKHLLTQNGKNIWICGGANIVQQIMKQNLIDIYYISIIPTILGNGIRLFESINHCINLHLLKTQNNNGVIELIYEKK